MRTSVLLRMLPGLLMLCWVFISSCGTKSTSSLSPYRVAFLDFVEDETLAKARMGFIAALNDSGISEQNGNLEWIYRNAQGDQPALIQACDFLLSQKPDLIATNSTLSTITAVQRTQSVPVCMMVAPRPDIAGLSQSKEDYPKNLFGTYETLQYIDSSLGLILSYMPRLTVLGVIYNHSEPQSVDAFEQLEAACTSRGIRLLEAGVTNSSETQLITASLLNRGIEAFFALPDNVVFSSFEVIVKECADKEIPVFTSEAGLTQRGAAASYGADFYKWGYQSGQQAAHFLLSGKKDLPAAEEVKNRVLLENKEVLGRLKSGAGLSALAP